MIPFADDTSTVAVSDLSIENGRAAVVITGNLQIARDRTGLRRARELQRVIDDIVVSLEGVRDLPSTASDEAAPVARDDVANPFG